MIFISVLVQRLPTDQRDRARLIGLGLAAGMRILLLLTLSWIIGLTATVITIGSFELSWRDIILIVGGLFLLWKASTEIHESVEGEEAHAGEVGGTASFGGTLAQIVALDIVFSLDSVLTAVGLVDEIPIMIAAILIAVGVMLVASGPLSRFVHEHPSVKMLALAFLLLIGVTLVADGLRVPHRQGVHLLRDGVLRVRRGAEPGPASGSSATPSSSTRRSSRTARTRRRRRRRAPLRPPELRGRVAVEQLGEPRGIAERDHVPARNGVRRDPEPFLRDAPLERRGKHAVVAPGDHTDRNVGQALEGPRLTERRARLAGIEPERLFDQLVREVVVVDDAVVVELGGGEAELSGVLPLRWPLTGVRPPLAERLARLRDHRVQEDDQINAGPFADERRGEPAVRLGNEHDVGSAADRFASSSAYSASPAASSPAGRSIGTAAWPQRLELGAEPVPLPCEAAGSRDEHERRHA